jgi:hypothetical protein
MRSISEPGSDKVDSNDEIHDVFICAVDSAGGLFGAAERAGSEPADALA